MLSHCLVRPRGDHDDPSKRPRKKARKTSKNPCAREDLAPTERKQFIDWASGGKHGPHPLSSARMRKQRPTLRDGKHSPGADELVADVVVYGDPSRHVAPCNVDFVPTNVEERTLLERWRQMVLVVERLGTNKAVGIPFVYLKTSCGKVPSEIDTEKRKTLLGAFRRAVCGSKGRKRGGEWEPGITRELRHNGVKTGTSTRSFEMWLEPAEQLLPTCYLGTLIMSVTTHGGGAHVHAESEFGGEMLALCKSEGKELAFKNELRFFFKPAQPLPPNLRLSVQVPSPAGGGKYLVPFSKFPAPFSQAAPVPAPAPEPEPEPEPFSQPGPEPELFSQPGPELAPSWRDLPSLPLQ
ncbi:MAG: hypothetical protein MHM6MM_008145 [Cercozoa sp. M6MM]